MEITTPQEYMRQRLTKAVKWCESQGIAVTGVSSELIGRSCWIGGTVFLEDPTWIYLEYFLGSHCDRPSDSFYLVPHQIFAHHLSITEKINAYID